MSCVMRGGKKLREQAPKWEFALEDPGQSPQQAGPLFLGALPPRPPPAFSAILSFRPSTNALFRYTCFCGCFRDVPCDVFSRGIHPCMERRVCIKQWYPWRVYIMC